MSHYILLTRTVHKYAIAIATKPHIPRVINVYCVARSTFKSDNIYLGVTRPEMPKPLRVASQISPVD